MDLERIFNFEFGIFYVLKFNRLLSTLSVLTDACLCLGGQQFNLVTVITYFLGSY